MSPLRFDGCGRSWRTVDAGNSVVASVQAPLIAGRIEGVAAALIGVRGQGLGEDGVDGRGRLGMNVVGRGGCGHSASRFGEGAPRHRCFQRYRRSDCNENILLISSMGLMEATREGHAYEQIVYRRARSQGQPFARLDSTTTSSSAGRVVGVGGEARSRRRSGRDGLLLEAGGSDDVSSVMKADQCLLTPGTSASGTSLLTPKPRVIGRRIPISMGKVLEVDRAST
jgi:hypothetical protein